MEAVTNIFSNIIGFVAPKLVRVIDDYNTIVATNEAGEEVIIQVPRQWHYENIDKDDHVL